MIGQMVIGKALPGIKDPGPSVAPIFILDHFLYLFYTAGRLAAGLWRSYLTVANFAKKKIVLPSPKLVDLDVCSNDNKSFMAEAS